MTSLNSAMPTFTYRIAQLVHIKSFEQDRNCFFLLCVVCVCVCVCVVVVVVVVCLFVLLFVVSLFVLFFVVWFGCCSCFFGGNLRHLIPKIKQNTQF